MPRQKERCTTFIIDFPFVFFSGVLFCLLANTTEVYIPFYKRSAFYHGLVFCTLIYAVALVSFFVEPAWMFMYYLKEPSIQVQGFFYLYLILYLSPFIMGFALGYELHKNSFLSVALLMILAVILQVMVVAFLWDRYWWVGTVAQYQQGKGLPLSEHKNLFWITLAGAGVLGLYFTLLAKYYWNQRWKNYMSPSFVVHALYPSQIRVVQALGEHLFEPIYTNNLLEEERLGKKFSEYMGSSPWINQVAVSFAVEVIQILPVFLLFKPRFFTSLSTQDKDRFLEKLEHSRIATFNNLILILKTMLSLLYYEEEKVYQQVTAPSGAEETKEEKNESENKDR